MTWLAVFEFPEIRRCGTYRDEDPQIAIERACLTIKRLGIKYALPEDVEVNLGVDAGDHIEWASKVRVRTHAVGL